MDEQVQELVYRQLGLEFALNLAISGIIETNPGSKAVISAARDRMLAGMPQDTDATRQIRDHVARHLDLWLNPLAASGG